MFARKHGETALFDLLRWFTRRWCMSRESTVKEWGQLPFSNRTSPNSGSRQYHGCYSPPSCCHLWWSRSIRHCHSDEISVSRYVLTVGSWSTPNLRCTHYFSYLLPHTNHRCSIKYHIRASMAIRISIFIASFNHYQKLGKKSEQSINEYPVSPKSRTSHNLRNKNNLEKSKKRKTWKT